jgi:hypothetical protein
MILCSSLKNYHFLFFHKGRRSILSGIDVGGVVVRTILALFIFVFIGELSLFAKNRFCKSYGAAGEPLHTGFVNVLWFVSKGVFCTINDGINKSSGQIIGLIFLGLLGFLLGWLKEIVFPEITWERTLMILGVSILVLFGIGRHSNVIVFREYSS